MKHIQLIIPPSLHKKLQESGREMVQYASSLYYNDLAAKLSLTALVNSFTGIDKYSVKPPESAPILRLPPIKCGNSSYNCLTSTVLKLPGQTAASSQFLCLPMYAAGGNTKDAALHLNESW